jgi:Domain of unknown function (DUF1707)/Cell wall-active antibiotics response 4TMS YvqF
MTESLEPDSHKAPPPVHLAPLAERVSDAERDQTVSSLREHVVVGRLTLDEFSARVEAALAARTRGELVATMTDLPTQATAEKVPDQRGARRRFIAVMSGSEAKGRWRVAEHTTAVAVMGGVDIDLRRAEMQGPEVVITAVAFWGGISLVVPEGFDVELEGFSFMGGRNLQLRDVPRIPGSPRIRVRGFAVMGGINVESKPARTGRELGKSIIGHVLGAVSSHDAKKRSS